MQVNKFYKEQTEILDNFLNSYIYPKLSDNKQIFGLELILTPDCNKNCSYCYLQKHKDKLYPIETRNIDNILHNLELLFKYYIKNNIKIKKIDLYSGEIWGSDFANKVFDIILQYGSYIGIENIIIPTNASFIEDNVLLSNVENYQKKFQQQDITIMFSLSYDGILDEINRPFNIDNHSINSNKIFEFAKKYFYGFHPMVSAHNIEKWVENHHFWEEKAKKYDLNLLRDVMFLEVRDGNWTEENIKHYLSWLQTYSDYILKEVFKNNYLEALFGILRLEDCGCSYVPFFQHLNHNEISCSLTQQLVVRLGDLTILPCHRLSYEKYIYGYYKIDQEKDEIVDVIGKNVILMQSNLLLGGSSHLRCDTCPFAKYCIKQCHGACFEENKETFYPIESVCNLEICKILFSLNLILDLKEKINQEDYNGQLKVAIDKITQFLNEIKNNQKEYDKWIQIVENYRLKF